MSNLWYPFKNTQLFACICQTKSLAYSTNFHLNVPPGDSLQVKSISVQVSVWWQQVIDQVIFLWCHMAPSYPSELIKLYLRSLSYVTNETSLGGYRTMHLHFHMTVSLLKNCMTRILVCFDVAWVTSSTLYANEGSRWLAHIWDVPYISFVCYVRRIFYEI